MYKTMYETDIISVGILLIMQIFFNHDPKCKLLISLKL